MNIKPTVLVVEDDPSHQQRVIVILEPIATLLIAKSFRKALGYLDSEGKNIKYVILDGLIPMFDDEMRLIESTDLIFHIKDRYELEIPVFAASSDDSLNQKFVTHGCFASNKSTAPLEVKKRILEETAQKLN